jgi:hypothetical protein
MTLMKIPAPVASVNAGMVRTSPPPLPTPAAASNASPDVAALMAQLAAAQAALASEKARADAAEAAKAAGVRGYTMKASEKGCISIYGVSARFPTTLYAPHLVGIVRDLIVTGKAAAFLRENAGKLSVKIDSNGQVGTAESVAEIHRLADELTRLTGK